MTPVTTSPARASVWEWVQSVLIVANLAWTTLCLGGYRPETMIVTSALNGVLLAVHLLSRGFDSEGGSARFHPAGWFLLPFLAYAAVNVMAVTPVRWLGWKDWLGWAQMILVFWVVVNSIRATSTRTFLFAGVVAIAACSTVLAGYQRFVKPDWLMMGRTQAEQFIGRASGSFGIPNSLAALLLLLIPPLGVLALRKESTKTQRVVGASVGVLLAAGLILTISRGAWISLALVLIAWPVFARGSWRRRAALVGGAAAAVCATVAVLFLTMPSVKKRFVQMQRDAGEITRPIMWRGAWKIFEEHRAWGGGAGSYNVLFEKHRPEKYQDEPTWAHNDYVNTLSDYGLAGFALFFGAAGVIAVRSARGRDALARDWLDEPAVQGALCAGVIAFALQLFVDFHFKIPALSFDFAIVTGLIVQRSWRLRRSSGNTAYVRPGWRRAGFPVLAVGALGATWILVTPFYRGEALRYSARQAIGRMAGQDFTRAEEKATLTTVLADLKRATELAPSNGQAWSDYAYAQSLWAHVEPSRVRELGEQSEQSAARALALSEVVPEFWIRRGVALDMQGKHPDAGGAFVRAILLAPANAKVWFYQAFHLGLDRSDTPLALAAVDFCLRLDPGNTEAQSLRQRLASGRRAP
jgi:O-antigen ligase